MHEWRRQRNEHGCGWSRLVLQLANRVNDWTFVEQLYALAMEDVKVESFLRVLFVLGFISVQQLSVTGKQAGGDCNIDEMFEVTPTSVSHLLQRNYRCIRENFS